MVDHRRRDDAAQRAQAGDGDGRTAEFLARCLGRARRVGQARDLRSGGPQVARLGVAQYRHHQAAVGLRRDADVHRAIAGDDAGIVVEARVDLRKFAHRQHDRARQQRQQREAAALGTPLRVQPRAQRLQLGDVDLFDVGEVRDAALGLLHLLRDLAAQADDGDGLFVVPLGVAGASARGLRARSACRVGVEVLVRDPPVRAAARNELQLDAQVPCAPAHCGGGDGLVARSTRRLRDRRGERFRAAAVAAGLRQRARAPPMVPRCCLRGRGGRCLHIACAFDFDANQLAPDRHHLADLAAERDHRADDRRWNLHRCLVGHHVREHLVLGHRVARLHMPCHEFHFGNAFADVRHLDHMHAHHASPSEWQCSGAAANVGVVHHSIARLNAVATCAGPGK